MSPIDIMSRLKVFSKSTIISIRTMTLDAIRLCQLAKYEASLQHVASSGLSALVAHSNTSPT